MNNFFVNAQRQKCQVGANQINHEHSAFLHTFFDLLHFCFFLHLVEAKGKDPIDQAA